MFGKLKNLVDSISDSVKEVKNEIKQEIETETSNSLLGLKKNSTTNEINSDEKVNFSNENFDNFFNKGKKAVLNKITDIDAKTTTEVIKGASSFIPFMGVLEITDKLNMTDSSAFTERMINNLQEVAKKELEKEDS